MLSNGILFIDKNRVITVQILSSLSIAQSRCAEPAGDLKSMCVSSLRA